MRWIGTGEVSRGVRERRFDVETAGRLVPGLVWTPEQASGELPLVLLGHGATLHKRSPYLLSLARRLVRHHGFAAAAIDGPVHGERRPDGGGDPDSVGVDFRKLWALPGTTDAVVADWTATLDALQGQEGIGAGPVAYWGLSMGTIFGLPFVAGEPRVRAAVLGLMGAVGPTARRLSEDAARLRCPVLFLLQWDDELVPRESALSLFGALGASDRRLHAHPGPHQAVPPEEIAASESFLAAYLTAPAER